MKIIIKNFHIYVIKQIIINNKLKFKKNIFNKKNIISFWQGI